MRTLRVTRAWILICSIAVVSTTTRHRSSHHDGASHHGDSTGKTLQDPMGPSAVQIPEHIWATQDVALTSPDTNIFDIMNKAKKSCKGNDLKCTFYHFINHRYENIGTVDVDKELFDDLLTKFDNWHLTAENIKKYEDQDVKTEEEAYNEDATTAGVREKDRRRNKVRHVNNSEHVHSHDEKVHSHHVRNGHESHHNKDGNSIKTDPVDKRKYFEIVLPKNNETGKQKTIYVEVDEDNNEFILLDEDINKDLIDGKTIKIELDELSEIADKVFNDSDKALNHKKHNDDYFNDDDIVVHDREHEPNDLSGLLENDNDTDIHQTDDNEESSVDGDESIIPLEENNDIYEYDDINDTSYFDTNFNEALNVESPVTDDNLTATPNTSIINTRKSDYTGLTINQVPCPTETVLDDLLPVSSLPVGKDFAKTLETHALLQSSFPVYATLESPPDSDLHPTITSSYSPSEFSSNAFSPSSILPCPPIEYVMRLKESQQSPFNVGFTWLPSYSRIEELRSPCLKSSSFIDEGLLPEKPLLPISSQELPCNLKSLDNSIPVEIPCVSLVKEIPISTVPCHLDADTESQISNTIGSVPITPEFNEIPLSVMPCAPKRVETPSEILQAPQSVPCFPAKNNAKFLKQLPFDTSSTKLSPMLDRKESIFPCSPYVNKQPCSTIPYTANPHLKPSYLESLSPTLPLTPNSKIPARNLPKTLDRICPCTNGDYVQQTKPNSPQLLTPTSQLSPLNTQAQAPIGFPNNFPYRWNNIPYRALPSSSYNSVFGQNTKNYPLPIVDNSSGDLIENIFKPCLSKSVSLPSNGRPCSVKNIVEISPSKKALLPLYTALKYGTPPAKIHNNLKSSPFKYPCSKELDSFLIGPHLNIQSPTSSLDLSNFQIPNISPPTSPLIIYDNSLIGPNLSTSSNIQQLESDSSYANYLDSSLVGPNLQRGSPPVNQDKKQLSQPVFIQPDVSLTTATKLKNNPFVSILDSSLIDAQMTTVSGLKPLPNDEIKTIYETLPQESEFTDYTPLDYLSLVKKPIKIMPSNKNTETQGITENMLSNFVGSEGESSNFIPLDLTLFGPNLDMDFSNMIDIKRSQLNKPLSDIPLIPIEETYFEDLEQSLNKIISPIDRNERVINLPLKEPVNTQHKTMSLETSGLDSQIHLDNSLTGPSLMDEIPSEISTLDTFLTEPGIDTQEFTTASDFESSLLAPTLENAKEPFKKLSLLKPDSYLDSSLKGPSFNMPLELLDPCPAAEVEYQPDNSLIGPNLSPMSALNGELQPESVEPLAASLLGPPLDIATTIAQSICPSDLLKLLSNPIIPMSQRSHSYIKSDYRPTPKTFSELLSNLQRAPCTSVSPYAPYIQMLTQPSNTNQFLKTTSGLKPSNILPLDSNTVLTDDEKIKSLIASSPLGKYISSLTKNPCFTCPKESSIYDSELTSSKEIPICNSEQSPIINDDIMSMLDENSLKLLEDASDLPIRPYLTSTVAGIDSPSVIGTTPILNTNFSNTRPILPGPMLPSLLYGPHLDFYNPQKIPYKQTPNIPSSNFESYVNLPLEAQFSKSIGPAPKLVTLPTGSSKEPKTPRASLNSISTEYSPVPFRPTSSNTQSYTRPLPVSYVNPISKITATSPSYVPSVLSSPLSLHSSTDLPISEFISPYQPIISILPVYSYPPNTALKRPLTSAVPSKPIVPYPNPSLLPCEPLLAETGPCFSKALSDLTPTESNLYSPIHSQSKSTPMSSAPMSLSLGSLDYSSPLDQVPTNNLRPTPYDSIAPLSSLTQPLNHLPSAFLNLISPQSLNKRKVPSSPALNPPVQLTPRELQLLKLINTLPISNINSFSNSYHRPPKQTGIQKQSNSLTNQIVPWANAIKSNLESPLTEELLFNNPDALICGYDRGDNYERLNPKYPLESLSYTLAPEEIAEPLKVNLLKPQESITSSTVNDFATKPIAPLYSKALLEPYLKSLHSPNLIDNIPPIFFNNMCPLQNAVVPPPTISYRPSLKPALPSSPATILPRLPLTTPDISASPNNISPMNNKSLFSPYYTPTHERPLAIDPRLLRNIISSQVTSDLSVPIQAPSWIDSTPVRKPKMASESYSPSSYIKMPPRFSAPKSNISPCQTNVMPSTTPLYQPLVTPITSHFSPYKIPFTSSSLKNIKQPITPKYISSILTLPPESLLNEATCQYYTPLSTAVTSPAKNLHPSLDTTPYTVSPTFSNIVEPIRDLNSPLSSVTPLLPLPTLTFPSTLSRPTIRFSDVVTTPYISKPVISNNIIPSSLFTISDLEQLSTDGIRKHRLPSFSLASPLETITASTISRPTLTPILKPKSQSLNSYSAPLPYSTQALEPIASYSIQPVSSVPYTSQTALKLSPIPIEYTVLPSTSYPTSPLQKLPLGPNPVLQYSLPSNSIYNTPVHPLSSVRNPFIKPDLKLYSEVPSYTVPNNPFSSPITSVENVILSNILKSINIPQKSSDSYNSPIISSVESPSPSLTPLALTQKTRQPQLFPSTKILLESPPLKPLHTASKNSPFTSMHYSNLKPVVPEPYLSSTLINNKHFGTNLLVSELSSTLKLVYPPKLPINKQYKTPITTLEKTPSFTSYDILKSFPKLPITPVEVPAMSTLDLSLLTPKYVEAKTMPYQPSKLTPIPMTYTVPTSGTSYTTSPLQKIPLELGPELQYSLPSNSRIKPHTHYDQQRPVCKYLPTPPLLNQISQYPQYSTETVPLFNTPAILSSKEAELTDSSNYISIHPQPLSSSLFTYPKTPSLKQTLLPPTPYTTLKKTDFSPPISKILTIPHLPCSPAYVKPLKYTELQSPSRPDTSIYPKADLQPIIKPFVSPHIPLQNIFSITELPLKLASAKQISPVNPLFQIQSYTENNQGSNSNKDYEVFESEMFTDIPPEFKGFNIPYSNKHLPRPQRLSNQDHFYENNQIGAKPEVFTMPDTLLIDPTDIMNDTSVLKEINKPKQDTVNLKRNEYPAILDSVPENLATTISPTQNYLKPCLESDSQYKYTPDNIDIPKTPLTVYPCNDYKDLKYSGYKTYQIPVLIPPQITLSVQSSPEINTLVEPQAVASSSTINQNPGNDTPSKLLDLLTPEYLFPIQPHQTKSFLNTLPENSKFSEYNTIVNKPIDEEDDELKTSLIDYINNKEGLKDNVDMNKELTIPLGNIAIIKKEPTNVDTIVTNNPGVGLKVWNSKVLIANAELKLKLKNFSVNNFMPIVNNLNKYDVDEIKKIVKNYIDEKYGNHIEINEPYNVDNKFTVIEDFDYNSSDNKYNLLWPTNYV